MKSLFLCLAVAAISTNANFDEYKITYQKEYGLDENARRAEIYATNLLHIAKQNARLGSWTAGVNEFTDWSVEEFASKRTGTVPPASDLFGGEEYPFETFNAALPDAVDWRTKANVVTPPKNQGTLAVLL